MKWVERWSVLSHTSDEKEYTVSLADDGETWGCSCPAWVYQRHRIRDGICKHIREVQAMLTRPSGVRVPDNITKDEFFTEEEFAL